MADDDRCPHRALCPRFPSDRALITLGLRVGIVLLSNWVWVSALEVVDLRCEGRVNPCGVDELRPVLSWRLEDDRFHVLQVAWQVQVASDLRRLHRNQPDLWDSGRVESDQSHLVPYSGRPLSSHQQVWWRVRVWDNHGRCSPWSRAAHWTMGILDPVEWQARWIGKPGRETTNWLDQTFWIWHPSVADPLRAPAGTNWFRRVVTLPPDRRIVRAVFEYTGDNECRGWLNGLDLGARNHPRRVKWNDITTRVEPGQTLVLGLTGRNTAPNKPAGVIGRLWVQFEEGPPLVIPTDSEWKVHSEEVPGWHRPDFEDSDWEWARVLGPAGMAPWGAIMTAEERRLPARWLRKEFVLDRPVRRALIHWSGLGWSELYLNGTRVGDAVLAPALSHYDKRVFYLSADVTRLLRRGANAMGAVLGNGRFYADRSRVYAGTVSYGFPQLMLHLRIEHTDGSVTTLATDSSWRLTDEGPIRSNSEFDGEEYDARRELTGWDLPGYDDADWEPASIMPAPAGQVVAQPIEPMRITQMLAPVFIREPSPGVFIFDFGQNLAGWCRLRVRGPAGTTVQLRHAERLRPDGHLDLANLRGAQQTDRYILKGQGEEIYEPRFTYHGFRYVELTGYPGRPGPHTLTACVVHDDLPRVGDFTCSHPLLNRIYQNVVWGLRANYRSIPTDCPQRDERQGWLGDRLEECAGEAHVFDVARFYRKWLRDIADAQRPSGSLPDVAPPYWPIYSDNVTWPSTFLSAPGLLYRQYGDFRFLQDTYSAAAQWIRYMSGYVTNGLISKDSYGDWCVPPEDPQLIHSRDPARRTDPTLIATAYFVHDLRLMARYARLLGRPEEAAAWEHQAQTMARAFHHAFYDSERGQYGNGTQTACILTLALNLVPESERDRVFATLVHNIEVLNHGHPATGLIGVQHLMRTLTRHGRPDLAFRIATQTNYPSWGYMVRQGATTIWELWNGDTAEPGMNSGNHVMLVGDLVLWLYECLAGIAPDGEKPGYRLLRMAPQFVPGLVWVSARRMTPFGLVHSEWRRIHNSLVWDICIPPNTTAWVELHCDQVDQVRINGQAVRYADGLLSVHTHLPRPALHLGSGRYQIVCP